jgi:predicted aspartyl protease
MLKFVDDEELFAIGASNYDYRPASKTDRLSRIFVEIEVFGMGSSVRTFAVADTGGAYFICPPEFAEKLNLDLGAYPDEKIVIRGQKIVGKLCRLPLKFLATEGEDLEIEVTAFIPNPELFQEWSLPPYIGWMGCLEQIRFAIDPSSDTFYFGQRPF